MFSSFMKNDSHRVDYLNFSAFENGCAFGVYVRGHLSANQPYSVEAKHCLFACLDYVNRYLDQQSLAAVYVDVSESGSSKNLAFYQLVADLRKGLLNKVLFADLENLFEDQEVYEMLEDLSMEVEGLEFFDLNGNLFLAKKTPVNQLLGV